MTGYNKYLLELLGKRYLEKTKATLALVYTKTKSLEKKFIFPSDSYRAAATYSPTIRQYHRRGRA